MIRRSLSIFLLLAASCAQAQDAATPATPAAPATPGMPATPASPATPATPAAEVKDPLVIKDTKVGTGAEAVLGSKVAMHYSGWLYKPMAAFQHGRKFDASYDRGEPLEFVLGAGKVIKGWDQGILGMKVGGRRTLIIPAHLAYGKRAVGDGLIPANSDLIFDVELMGVK